MFGLMKKSLPTVVLFIGFGLVASAGAATPNLNSDVLYGCVTPRNGNLTRISTTPPTCPANTSMITWGARGAQGPIGAQGATGSQGPKGDKGDVGLQGLMGLPGPIGPTGPQGIQGEIGERGATGDSGATGIQGPMGPQGTRKTWALIDSSNTTLLSDVSLFTYNSGFGWDSNQTLWFFDSNGVIPAGGVSTSFPAYESVNCSTGRISVTGRTLKNTGILYPSIQSQYISLALGNYGDWANKYYDNMTYFKGEKFSSEPAINSYFTDGSCRRTTTEDYKTMWARAFSMNTNDTTYKDWQFYALTPIDRPAGTGEGKSPRSL